VWSGVWLVGSVLAGVMKYYWVVDLGFQEGLSGGVFWRPIFSSRLRWGLGHLEDATGNGQIGGLFF